MARSQGGGQSTRKAIIEAAMRGFAEKGFAATSTREIAALAGTNIASISYHFGGKEGLRDRLRRAHRRADGRRARRRARRRRRCRPTPRRRARLLAALVRTIARFLLLQPEARLVAGFMLREMAAAVERARHHLHGLFERVHRRVCAIWGAATGREPESEAVRLAVFATIGQVLYFHIGRPVVERRMGWTAIGPAEVEAIADTVTRNLDRPAPRRPEGRA